MLILPWGCQASGRAVPVGVVGDAVDPAAPDDADPGAGEDADGVGVVVAAGAGVGVDLRGPRGGVPVGFQKAAQACGLRRWAPCDWGMIVRRVPAAALSDLRPARWLVGAARPLPASK